tara:strand:+ start:6476 stop:6814 length:339 start_codon:yes stop_codon:yes gene_type:complete
MKQMKHYINSDGTYFGSGNKTKTLQEVPTAPEGNQIWNGTAWEDVPDTRTANEKAEADLMAAIDAKGLETVVAGLIKHLAANDATFSADTGFADMAAKAKKASIFPDEIVTP